jgi:hypothetical protein
MSYLVPANHVVTFNGNVSYLSQQKSSKLAGTVRNEGLKGKKQSFDRLGPTMPSKRQGRHSDTVLQNTPHDRRWVSAETWDWADMVDDIDKLKMLYDPTNPYAINAGMGFARLKDDVIIQAAFDTAYSGEDGLTAVAWPSSQQIVHNSTNLTLAKLNIAREMRETADVDEDEEWVMVVGPKQMTSLLGTTEIKSVDYNNVKALVQGQVDSFMGFRFIRTNRLLLDASGYTRCLSYCSSGIILATPQEINTTIGPRPDKNNNTQIHCTSTLGAARMEEAKVIEIVCTNV